MNRRELLCSMLGLSLAGFGLERLGVSTVWAAVPPPFPRPRPALSGASSAPRSPRPASKPLPPRLVVLDPGHGGHDPGAIGGRGTHEKDVTLDLALEIARQLEDRRGVKVRLTRSRDVFLPLPERVERARAARADWFISIHADSAPNREARGLSAYTLSTKATDDFARALARRENLADATVGLDLRRTDAETAAVLVDLVTRQTRNIAAHAKARLVQGAGRDLRLLDNPMRAANFAVLRAPDIPSVLLETGFLSNPEDEALLRNPGIRRSMAKVIAREIASAITAPPFV